MNRLRRAPDDTDARRHGPTAPAATEIASGPLPDWRWRLSIGEIAQSCGCPVLPATRRQCVALDAPVHLHGHDQPARTLRRLQATMSRRAGAARHAA
jgi:environmental stress-induced protein Ves